MRKGLVLTLGVALVLSVVPAFSEAPIISCIPDIVISDLDLGGQTADSNMFVFEDALDLDEHVFDADTADDQLRWSFIETGGSTIEINGIGSLDPATEDVKNPGAKNIRLAANGLITLENTAMDAASADQETQIQVVVSDGDKVDSQTVTVSTVNVAAGATSTSQDDALISKVIKTYEFNSGEEGWFFNGITVAGFMDQPAHAASGGALTMTESASGHALTIVYGAYEMPKAPTEAVQPSIGCVYRARYTLKASGAASELATPGFRLHAVTKHVALVGGQWQPDFRNLDFIDEGFVQYMTFTIAQQVRVPSAAGTEFIMLYYPNQVAETLLSTTTITYFTFELLDSEGGTDGGTLALDKLVIDTIDSPDPTVGTEVTTFTTTNFTSAAWEAGAFATFTVPGIGAPNTAGLTHGVVGTDLSITVAPGNQSFEAFINTRSSVNLKPGFYYRAIWELQATVTGTFVEPRVRLAAVSDYFIWIAVKEQQGGAAVAGLTQDPQMWELWFAAPSADPRGGAGATLTEGIKLRFGSWQADAVSFPVTSQVGGTVKALSVTTHEFEPIP